MDAFVAFLITGHIYLFGTVFSHDMTGTVGARFVQENVYRICLSIKVVKSLYRYELETYIERNDIFI